MVTQIKREKFEEYRMRIQSPVQRKYDEARYERLKKAVAERKKKRKEQVEKAKKYTAVKLKEVEKYGTKTLKKVGKRLEKVDITKEPKGYKQLQKGVERLFAQPKKRKVSSSELKRRRDFELKKMKLAHQQRMDYLKAQAEQLAQSQDPRFNPNPAEDQFLAEAQPEYPREEEYQQYSQPQSSNIKRRIMNGLGNIGTRLSHIGQRRPQVDRYGRPVQNIQNLPKEVQREINRKNTILNQPNVFNKPSGVNRQARLNLMDSERSKPQAKKLSFWRAE